MAKASAATIDAIDGNSFSDDERLLVLKAASRLVRRLESPMETAMEMVVMPVAVAVHRALYDLKLFEKWAEFGINEPATSSKLAELTGSDAYLLGRMLRHLVSVGHLHIVGTNTFKTTSFSSRLVNTGYRDLVPFYSQICLPAIDQTPQYLQQRNYQNPADRNDTAFKERFGKTLFETLAKEPEKAAWFNETMKITSSQFSRSWIDIYPTDILLQAEGVLAVDLGGNQGHDLKKLTDKYTALPTGSLVLQDLPAGLAGAELPDAITPMEHDFFTPQPVKGARVYYIHRVLHDWPDKEVKEILRHLKDALKPGYSSILIHEMSVSTTNPTWSNTVSDLLMMSVISAVERTEEEWGYLAESVGLRIAHTYRLGTDIIIELVLT